ncbi:hypothetical protein B0I37DRAFT_395850 [Chaetomium sp. MPI-CAGE-AT-0009]|nr:hypothetical protein B0I37DRAFT_395850 [Chaetomium sp. MPI-CAGE-AT-0009]
MDPLFLSPALPSDLLQFIINRCTYPTTLIICTNRAEFLSSLTQDLLHQQKRPQSLPTDEPLDAPTTTQQVTIDPSHTNPPPPPPDHPQPDSKPGQQQHQTHQRQNKPHPLLTPHLAQLATTRSVRTVGDRPRLVVYGFLALHRGSSEWSVQGLGASSAVLVEAGKRAGVGVVVVEGPVSGPRPAGLAGGEEGLGLGRMTMGEVLAEGVPVLSGGGRRAGGELEGSGWAGKRVGVGRVLGRWFRFREGEWAVRERVGKVGMVEDRTALEG